MENGYIDLREEERERKKERRLNCETMDLEHEFTAVY